MARPRAVAPSAPPAGTLEMPSRPARVSPFARTMIETEPPPPAVTGDTVVFPGERLSRVDDFVRVRFYAERLTLDALLAREAITAAYYERMCARFDGARALDTALDEVYRARLGQARRAAPAPRAPRG